MPAPCRSRPHAGRYFPADFCLPDRQRSHAAFTATFLRHALRLRRGFRTPCRIQGRSISVDSGRFRKRRVDIRPSNRRQKTSALALTASFGNRGPDKSGGGIMSAHESMEQADHAKEASETNRNIALLIAEIDLCLALSETLGKGAQTESLSKNVEASNLWAFFQAKSIRRNVVQTAAEQGKLNLGTTSDDAAKAALQKQIEEWQKTAERYRSDPKTGEGQDQLSERAKEAEHERDEATAKYHHFELGSAAFQIGIVLASAAIITGMMWLAWG